MAITISLSGLNGDWQVNNQSGINRVWTRGIYSIVYSENMFGTSNAGWIVKITDGVEIFGIKTDSGEVWDDDAEIIWNPNATGYDDYTTANLAILVIEEANPIDVNPAYYKCNSVTETAWTGYKMKWDKGGLIEGDGSFVNVSGIPSNITQIKNGIYRVTTDTANNSGKSRRYVNEDDNNYSLFFLDLYQTWAIKGSGLYGNVDYALLGLDGDNPYGTCTEVHDTVLAETILDNANIVLSKNKQVEAGWIEEKIPTEGLIINGFIPEKDKVYNVNTTSLIYLYPDMPVAAAADYQINGNVVTITTGIFEESQRFEVGTSYTGELTITPDTSDETISADTYISSTVTIKGDSNLVASNIKDGITIFGVEGTYEGSGTSVDITNLTPENIRYGVTINGVDGTYTDASLEDYYYPVTSSDMRMDTVAWVNGQKVVGNMYELTATVLELEGTTSRMLDAGYYSDCRIEVWEDNLTPENIKDGITILGIEGTYKGSGSEQNLTNLTPENIKYGVTINNVEGTFTYVDADSSNPAEGRHILDGMVAYVNGNEVIGEIQYRLDEITIKTNNEVFSANEGAKVSTDGEYSIANTYFEELTVSVEKPSSGDIRKGATLFGVDGEFTGESDDGISLYKCVDAPAATETVNSVSSDSSDHIIGYIVVEHLIWSRPSMVFTATEDILNGKPIYYCAEYEEYLVLMKSNAGQYGWFMTQQEPLQPVLSGSMSQDAFMADSGNWDTSGLCSDGPCAFHEVTMELVAKVYTMYDGEIDSIVITPREGNPDGYTGMYTLDPATDTEYKYQRQFINADNGYVILFDNAATWNPSMSKWVLGYHDSMLAEMVAVSKVTGPTNPSDPNGDSDGTEYGYDTIEGICELDWNQCYDCVEETSGSIADMIPVASKPAASGGDSTPLTWSGRKITKDASGNYLIAEDVTYGLEIMGYTPEVGKVYSADTTINGNMYPAEIPSGSGVEFYRCESVVQPKVPVGFFANHSKVTETAPPGGWEGEPSYIYMPDIEYVVYDKTKTGKDRLWIDKNDIPNINSDYPLDVLGWDGKRWIMSTISSITDTPSDTNGVANSDCTNPDATMEEIASATWSWGLMGGDTFSDKVIVLEEQGAPTSWSGYKVTVGASPATEIKVTGAYDGVYALADASATGKDREFHLVGDTSEEPLQIMYYGTYWGLFDYSMAMVMLESDCTNPDATVQELCNATWTHIMDSSAELSFEPIGSAGEQWVNEGALIEGLSCDGFVPRIGKVYSIDSKLQATLSSDPAGAGFYQCSEGASVPSKIVISGAATEGVNGEYVWMPISFFEPNNYTSFDYYKDGSSSSSTDHYVLQMRYNQGSYSINIWQGYVEDNMFYGQKRLYIVSRKFEQGSNINAFISAMNEGIWTVQNGAVLPGPTAEYQSPGVTALEVVSAGTSEVIGKYIDIGVRIIEGTVVQKTWIKESGDYAIVIRNAPPTNAYLIKGYLYGNDTAFYQQKNMYNQCPVEDLTETTMANATWGKGSGDGALPAPEVEYLHIPATWKGYRLIQNSDGTWSKADVETANLKVGGEEPVVGTIYNEDATVTISGALGL